MNSQYHRRFVPSRRLVSRNGKLFVIVIVALIVAVAAIGIVYSMGGAKQRQVEKVLQKGQKAFQSNKGAEAAKAFAEAKSLFCGGLRFYRAVQGLNDKTVSENELDELLIAANLMAAYDRFLRLQPADTHVQEAHKAAANLSGKGVG